MINRFFLLFAVLLTAFKTFAQTENITLNTYNGESEIKASQSITLTAPFHIPAGNTARIYIGSIYNYPLLISQPTIGKNYVLSNIIKKQGVNSLSQLSGLKTNELNQSITYLDGLGRPIQMVTLAGSPEGKDIVLPMAYNVLGRENKKYLPYVAGLNNNGQLRINALTEQSGFYTNPSSGIRANTYPFSETVFEASPLSRVEQQGAPGASWQISAGHTQKLLYAVNSAQGGTYALKRYTAEASGTDHVRVLTDGGWYGAGQLYVTISKDENWQATDGQAGTKEEYKDKDGKQLLIRSFNRKPDNSIEILSTYYVYDDFDRLSFVLSPGANGDITLPDVTTQNNYCYRYSYDGQGRLIEKKVPGSGIISMVYNKRDQLVLSQDANQAGRQEWSFIRYDELGREIMTGLYTYSGTRAALQAILNTQVIYYDNRNNSLANGYTTNSYPSTGFSPLTITYYDSYDFPGNSFGQPASGQATDTYVKSLVTGTKTWTLESNPQVLLSVNYYDNEGRLIQLKSTNHLGGSDVINNSYSFSGELLNSTRTHIANGTTTTIANRYEYDHMGRRLKNYMQINSNPEVILSELSYNSLGQVIQKKLHDGLQRTRYAYNERGWLKESVSDQFKMKLAYDTLSTPQYNGNISVQEWGPNRFLYSYDKLNRLKQGISTGISMSEVLEYDKMGNISTLIRDGVTGNYSYNGNRLNSISGGLVTGTYAYDANGNATTDGRNGVTINYNILNLPVTINKSGLSMTYTYAATGDKLRKISKGNTTDYISGIQYLNGAIEFIHTEEGIARRNGSNYNYEYTLVDHLGNTRVTFYKNPATGNLEILQKDDYYPFGMRKNSLAASNDNKYLYNGKELQEELGQLDYGARFYDPVIGRWNVVDPLAEKYISSAPYNYVDNNPIVRIDPNGMEYNSTHTNAFGRVIAIYDDGDLGVYRHGQNTQKSDVDRARRDSGTTSGGGEYMGDTWTPFGFANFSYYEKNGAEPDGSVKVGLGARIDFNSNWAFYQVRGILASKPSAWQYSTKAGGGKEWDIKLKSPDGPTNVYYGSKLYDKYASARDAGNFVAGAVAQSSNIPNIILDYGFGLYNQAGNNKIIAAFKGLFDTKVSSFNPAVGIGILFYRANYGEDKLSKMGIEAGKSFIK